MIFFQTNTHYAAKSIFPVVVAFCYEETRIQSRVMVMNNMITGENIVE